jgi:hypothetical protein
MIYRKLFFFLFVCVTAANIYIYLNRNDFTFIKQSTSNEIYPDYSTLTANKFIIINDSTLDVVTNNATDKPTTWAIKKNGSAYAIYTGINPRLVLEKGTRTYTIFNNTGDSFYLQAEYLANEDYKKHQLTKQGGISIFNSDLLQEKKLNNLDKWRDDEVAVTTQEEQEILKILKDSIKIISTDITVEKVKKIGCYLSYNLYKSNGIPADSLLNLSVFNQYKCAVKGSPIWCGNFAMIFNLFAFKAGIKTRHVEINKIRSGIEGNLHLFNEYYIPEQKKWAAIDLTFNNIFYIGRDGKLLNAVEVKNTNPADSSIKVSQAQTATDLHSIAFSELDNSFKDIYNSHSDLKFYLSLNYNESNSFIKKLKRYFVKKYYYELYSDNTIIDNKKFYFKPFLLILQYIITALLLLVILFKFTRNKK